MGQYTIKVSDFDDYCVKELLASNSIERKRFYFLYYVGEDFKKYRVVRPEGDRVYKTLKGAVNYYNK